MRRDEQIFELIEAEKDRQIHGIELIASENFASDQVMEAAGSVLTNKYAEGYPGKRYYGGCAIVDEVEQIAIDRAKTLFGAEYANYASDLTRCFPVSGRFTKRQKDVYNSVLRVMKQSKKLLSAVEKLLKKVK